MLFEAPIDLTPYRRRHTYVPTMDKTYTYLGRVKGIYMYVRMIRRNYTWDSSVLFHIPWNVNHHLPMGGLHFHKLLLVVGTTIFLT